MFKKISKTYLALFFLFYAGYSFLNWLLITKTELVRIDREYAEFWAPFILIYIPVFFFLRPVLKKSGFKSKTQEAWLWILFPFSISVPTAISQPYFKDASYTIVNVNYPEDVLTYPGERFFMIKNFRVKNDGFTLFKERHVSGRKGKTLKVNNYYISPMFWKSGDTVSKIAYGLKFSTSLNHGLLFRDGNPQKIQEFNKKAEEDFLNYDLYDLVFFEKQMDSEDAGRFASAWEQNKLLDPNSEPVVLVGKTETLRQLLKRERDLAIYSVVISLAIVLGLLWVFEYFRKKRVDNNSV